MRGRRAHWLTAVVCVGVLWGGAVLAQNQNGEEQALRTPRNSVRGGTVAARRPGLWVQDARGRHNAIQQEAIHNFGGAEPTPADAVTPSFGETMRIEFLTGLFEVLNQMATQLRLALEAAKVINTGT